jgi:MFS family permease
MTSLNQGMALTPAAERRAVRQSHVLLALLMIAMILSFLSRVILGLLIKPIRADLALDDTQFSLLFGLVFAAPYALSSLFMGSLVDRRRRLSVLAWAIFLWSAATIASMAASTFWMLAAARICVAIGEAAVLPCAYSLLADRFPPRQLGRAYSTLIMGANFGTGIALVFGSSLYDVLATVDAYSLPLLGAIKPWQMTFLIAGLPGLALAVAIACLPEPARKFSSKQEDPVGMGEALRGYARFWPAYVAFVIGFAFAAMSLQTVQIFGVQHFVRTFGMSLGEAGLRIGLPVAIVGPVGLWVGGWLNDRWRGRGLRDAPLRVGMVSATGLLISTAIAMGARNIPVAQAALLFVGFFSNFPFGAAASGMISITPQRARGTITAIYTLTATLLGAGMAPLATALITDHVLHSEAKVGFAVAIVCGLSSISAMLLYLFGRTALLRASVAAD